MLTETISDPASYGLLGGAAAVAFAIITFIDRRETRQQAHADAEIALIRKDLDAERAAHIQTRLDVARLTERSQNCEAESAVTNAALAALQQRFDDLMTPAPRTRTTPRKRKATTP